MPDVDEEDLPRGVAVVPHFVFVRVGEDEAPALLPRPGRPVHPQEAVVGYPQPEVQGELVVVVIDVRGQPGARLHPGDDHVPRQQARVLLKE